MGYLPYILCRIDIMSVCHDTPAAPFFYKNDHSSGAQVRANNEESNEKMIFVCIKLIKLINSLK